jgi:hypothetical protein
LTQILDEKSLIKKYQKEITSLKTELEQLKHSILEQPFIVNTSQEDLVHLRQQVSVQFKSVGCVCLLYLGLATLNQEKMELTFMSKIVGAWG